MLAFKSIHYFKLIDLVFTGFTTTTIHEFLVALLFEVLKKYFLKEMIKMLGLNFLGLSVEYQFLFSCGCSVSVI